MFSFVLRLRDTAAADALFSEAYACIDQGLCYEECNDRENAASMYERGLNLIMEAEKAKNAKKSELYKHLMEAKPSVTNRLKVLEKEIAEGSTEKDEKCTLEKQEQVTFISYYVFYVKSELRGCLEEVGDAEAEVIFSIPDGVQLFTIDGDNTTTPTYPTSLQVLHFSGHDASSKTENSEMDKAEKPSALIQVLLLTTCPASVGPWVYPLVPGQTPVLRNDFGAYVVSNPTTENPNVHVNLNILPLPFFYLRTLVLKWMRSSKSLVLRRFSVLRDQNVKKDLSEDDNKRISNKIAQLLIYGGERIAWGVETTAVKVTSYLDDKGERYRATIGPSGKPVSINPALKGSLLYMHKGSKLVAKCTRYLLDKVGDMGVSIGRSLASGAEKTFGKGSAGGVVSGTISVLGGGITGVSTVWMALEDNSRSLCRSIADQTVKTVQIKYGDEASEAAHHALFAAGHGSLAAAQLWDLGPRSIAGRMARRAGVQVRFPFDS
ncbi:hypothetical protein ANCCAN_23010 [Ancylostoma caninum]|uniref:MIT domain-containing protein n=2 Tax=Ancylostoma TaxID=29169 RepID=A0A368FK79_ANCCA|nr:hypothetical protein ANCCAN_23010 [Ancylostoma caninum]